MQRLWGWIELIHVKFSNSASNILRMLVIIMWFYPKVFCYKYISWGEDNQIISQVAVSEESKLPSKFFLICLFFNKDHLIFIYCWVSRDNLRVPFFLEGFPIIQKLLCLNFASWVEYFFQVWKMTDRIYWCTKNLLPMSSLLYSEGIH